MAGHDGTAGRAASSGEGAVAAADLPPGRRSAAEVEDQPAATGGAWLDLSFLLVVGAVAAAEVAALLVWLVGA